MKFFAALFIVFCFSHGALAQSVVVTPRKVVYTRKDPVSPEKATVAVVYPKSKAANPALSRRIQKTVTKLDVKRDIIADQWLESAGYTVEYNKKGILSITLSMSGTGAFSSTLYRCIVVDIKTGKEATVSEVFRDLPGLAALIGTRQKDEITEAKKEIALQSDYPVEVANRFLDTADFTVRNLREFSIGDEGVTFIYDYGFPRTIYPIQPAGNFQLTWKELKPFISRRGLLGKFIS
jgi:hypothetical protein